MKGPAYRVVTERLIVRCWDPVDAPKLKEAIDASLEHLRPWMPWAHNEPQTVEEKVALLRGFRGKFDADEDYVYAIFDLDESRVLGGTGLHTRIGEHAREIGYWIRVDAEGNGYVTEAVAALTRVGFELEGLERIEIRVEPENVRSRRIPERLGYAEEATLRGRVRNAQDEPRDVVVYSLFSDAYPQSPAASATLQAYDAAGAKLL
jgi:RimJ/RimL family protein N-acetyltransferase